MRKELFRLTKSKVLWCIVALVIVVYFIFAIEFSLNSSTVENYVYHSISEYKSTDEIHSYIDDLERLEKLLDTSDEDYEKDLQYITQSIAIYNYLYENRISYNEFKSSYSVYMGMYEKSNNRVIYSEYMLNISFALLLFSLIVCSTILVCYDFSSDLYKNIYGTNKKRSLIYRSKFLAYTIFAAILSVILLFLTFITSFQFNLLTPNIICFGGNKLFILKSTTYILLNYMFQIIGFLPYAFLIYGLSTLIKNTYLNLVLCTVSCLMPFALSAMSVPLGRNWYVLRMGLINMFNGFYVSWLFIAVFVIEALISMLCIWVGRRLFLRRNL